MRECCFILQRMVYYNTTYYYVYCAAATFPGWLEAQREKLHSSGGHDCSCFMTVVHNESCSHCSYVYGCCGYFRYDDCSHLSVTAPYSRLFRNYYYNI